MSKIYIDVISPTPDRQGNQLFDIYWYDRNYRKIMPQATSCWRGQVFNANLSEFIKRQKRGKHRNTVFMGLPKTLDKTKFLW